MYLKTREDLIRLILSFRDGALSLGEFQRSFEFIYLDREPYPILDPHDDEFFGRVLKKVSWTCECPTNEDRDLGYIDEEELQGWLAGALARYRKGREEEGRLS